MVPMKRLVQALAVLALCSAVVPRAQASPLASGMFASDNSFFSYTFTTASSQNYTFATTSFASGGFVPVLTLFNTLSGNLIAFAETDNSDVSLSALLSPSSYILYLTEDPNVAFGKLSDGFLFANNPTITGDTCSVSGGKFLNVFDGCTQRTVNFAVNVTVGGGGTAVTPEPATWLLLLPPVALLTYSQRRRLAASRPAVACC